MNLYELTSEYQELLAMVEDPEIEPELIADTMEAVAGEIENKAVGYAKVIKCAEADAEVIEIEISRLMARKKAIKNGVDRMKASLMMSMQACGIKKVDIDPRFKITIKKNGGLQPMEIVGDVPEEFMYHPEPEPDKKKIREYLKDNQVEWAVLKERGESLLIR